MTETRRIVVMGVSGCGKSLVGREIAIALALPFFDADDFHGPENRAKMQAGIPLTDADRAGWLDRLAELLDAHPSGLVLACSALKRRYRDRLRAAAPDLAIIYLTGDFETVRARLSARRGHYFTGDDMLRSQFATLEPPEDENAHPIDVGQSPEAVIAACLAALRGEGAAPRPGDAGA
jgi:gluconokinase